MSGLGLVVRHEFRMLARNKKVVLGQVIAVVILWSLLANNIRQGAHEQLTGYFFLLLFVAAVGVPASVGVHAFVGEKERGTMEALLLLPISMRALIGGKWLATLAVALIELGVVYLGGVAAAKLYARPDQYHFVVNTATQFVAAVIAPLSAALFALVAIIVSGKSSNTQSALSVTAFVAAPILLVLLGVLLGLLAVTRWSVLAASGALLVADLIAYRVALSALTPETLIRRRA
jgi:ABC-type Na+ efflux pump permease subunit